VQGRLFFLALWTLLVTVGHFSVSSGSSGDSLIHILLSGLYLLPIVVAALWWGLRGGLGASLGVSIAFLLPMLKSPASSPMEGWNQAMTVGVFLLLGTVTGGGVDRLKRLQRLRQEEEARAQREAMVEGLASLANALGHRDEPTRKHCDRVAHFAVEIGRRRGLSPERLELLRLAALVHDIGKIGIRDDILFKPEELTPEERILVERHPTFAADILRPMRGTEDLAEIVLSHHECPNGTGYPRGLSGEQIILEARILQVSDVFSALTEARQYKPSMKAEAALAWMQEQAGTKLDGESVRAIRAIVQDGIPEPA